MNKTPWVDPKKCIACAACVSLAPKTFELDMNDANATAVAKGKPGDKDGEINLAIQACPTAAISWKKIEKKA